MQVTDPDLIVAVGTCNTQGGLGDAYLPFREVLGILTGTVADRALSDAAKTRNADRLKTIGVRTVQVIVEAGPDLVGAIVPGASLIATVGKAIAHRAGWMDELDRLSKPKHVMNASSALDQNHLFEQYCNVLLTLAKEKLLLLILDDLHWADDSSIGLLFHLSRRMEASRILIVGTYRPDEVALVRGSERNLLEKIALEIKRYAGDVTIDLAAAKVTEGTRVRQPAH